VTPFEKKVLMLLREIEKNTRPVSVTAGPVRGSWGGIRELADDGLSGEVLRRDGVDNG
jgi:hypothetical protein